MKKANVLENRVKELELELIRADIRVLAARARMNVEKLVWLDGNPAHAVIFRSGGEGNRMKAYVAVFFRHMILDGFKIVPFKGELRLMPPSASYKKGEEVRYVSQVHMAPELARALERQVIAAFARWSRG